MINKLTAAFLAMISLFFHASIGVSLPGKFKTGETLSRNHVSYYNAQALYLFSF